MVADGDDRFELPEVEQRFIERAHFDRAPLICAECGAVAPLGAPGWRAYLADDDPAEVAIYCPECAEREFG